MPLSSGRSQERVGVALPPISHADQRARKGVLVVSALRLFAIYLVVPTLALSAQILAGWDKVGVALALGAIGVTQAVLHTPLTLVADRFGHRAVFLFGLSVLALGSWLGALAESPSLLIVARLLQGAGVLSGVSSTLLAALDGDRRLQSGPTTGAYWLAAVPAIAIGLGALIGAVFNLETVFALASVFAVLGICLVLVFMPTQLREPTKPSVAPAAIEETLRSPDLARISLGAFVLHAVCMALLVVIPLQSIALRLANIQYGYIYSVGAVLALVALVSTARTVTELGSRRVFFVALGCLTAAIVMVAASPHGAWLLAFAIVLLLVAFTVLEAKLPLLVERYAAVDDRAAAQSVYATMKYLGTFGGGLLGGVVAHYFGASAVLGICLILTVIWSAVMSGLHPLRDDAIGEFGAE